VCSSDLVVRELAPGVEFASVAAQTGAKLHLAPDWRVIA